MLRNSIFSALFIDNSNYILNFANENRDKQVKNLQNRETNNSEAEGPTLTKQRNKTGADTTPAPFKNRKRDNKQNTNRGATLTTKTKVMNTKQEKNPAQIYAEFGPVGVVFQWLDEHPRAASVLLWLQGLALAYVVFTYEFTIPAYK